MNDNAKIVANVVLGIIGLAALFTGNGAIVPLILFGLFLLNF